MGILAKPLGYFLQWVYNLVGVYGIALIILTVIVKLVMYPLYKKQIMSTAGMGDLQSKVRDIQRRYANDRETANQKIQELYKQENVNPMSGCLPMLIQMIIIMGLFALVRNPINYVASEKMVFASHESFLWINDLAQPDPWILPILAGVATFIATYMSQKTGAMPGQQQSGAMNIVMRFIFPILILWLARTYPAGLALYWFISQVIQIFYNIRFGVLRRKMREQREQANKKVRRPVRAGEGVRR